MSPWRAQDAGCRSPDGMQECPAGRHVEPQQPQQQQQRQQRPADTHDGVAMLVIVMLFDQHFLLSDAHDPGPVTLLKSNTGRLMPR